MVIQLMVPTAAEPKGTKLWKTLQGHVSSQRTAVEDLEDDEGDMGEKCYSLVLNCASLIYTTDIKVYRFVLDFFNYLLYRTNCFHYSTSCERLRSIPLKFLQGNISYFSYLPRLSFTPVLFIYQQMALLSTTQPFPYS